MIKEFEIQNFKCFKNFKVEGLSKINIISGDNNVGKTALLELISIIINTNNIFSFRKNLASVFLF